MFSLAFGFVTNLLWHPFFGIGYALAVLFPIPFINSTILTLWNKVGSSIMVALGKESKSAEATLENSVETAVVKAVSANVPAVIAAVVVQPTAAPVPVSTGGVTIPGLTPTP